MRSRAGPVTEISVFATKIPEAEGVYTQFYSPQSQQRKMYEVITHGSERVI